MSREKVWALMFFLLAWLDSNASNKYIGCLLKTPSFTHSYRHDRHQLHHFIPTYYICYFYYLIIIERKMGSFYPRFSESDGFTDKYSNPRMSRLNRECSICVLSCTSVATCEEIDLIWFWCEYQFSFEYSLGRFVVVAVMSSLQMNRDFIVLSKSLWREEGKKMSKWIILCTKPTKNMLVRNVVRYKLKNLSSAEWARLHSKSTMKCCVHVYA